MKARLIAIEITGEGNHLDTRMTWLAIEAPDQFARLVWGEARASFRPAAASPTRPKSAQAPGGKRKSRAIPKR